MRIADFADEYCLYDSYIKSVETADSGNTVI